MSDKDPGDGRGTMIIAAVLLFSLVLLIVLNMK
jgi:hypothetical protein